MSPERVSFRIGTGRSSVHSENMADRSLFFLLVLVLVLVLLLLLLLLFVCVCGGGMEGRGGLRRNILIKVRVQ